MAIDAKGSVSIFDSSDDIYASPSEPVNKVVGMLWLDTTVNVLKRWTGTAWEEIIDSRVSGLAEAITAQETSITLLEGSIDLLATKETVNQLTERVSEAELKITPEGITSTVRSSEEYLGDLGTINAAVDELADGKTTVYYQDEAPASPSVGDIWYDTDAEPVVVYKYAAAGAAEWANLGTTAATASAGSSGAVRHWFERVTVAGTYSCELTLSAVSDNAGGGSSSDEALVLKTASSGSDRAGTQLLRLVLSQLTASATFTGTFTLASATDFFYIYLKPYAAGISAALRIKQVVENEEVTYEWEDVTTPTLSAALAAAGDAQSTADGKIVTYAQDEAPAEGMTVGDLWVDTNDSNKLRRWNGTQWAGVEDLRVSTCVTEISQLSDRIDLKASQSDMDSVNQALLSLTPEGIVSTVTGSTAFRDLEGNIVQTWLQPGAPDASLLHVGDISPRSMWCAYLTGTSPCASARSRTRLKTRITSERAFALTRRQWKYWKITARNTRSPKGKQYGEELYCSSKKT